MWGALWCECDVLKSIKSATPERSTRPMISDSLQALCWSLFNHTLSGKATKREKKKIRSKGQKILFLKKENNPPPPQWYSSQPLLILLCQSAGNALLRKVQQRETVIWLITTGSSNVKHAKEKWCLFRLTEHGLQLDQAADEVVKVDHIVLCVPSYQNLIQFVVQLKT